MVQNHCSSTAIIIMLAKVWVIQTTGISEYKICDFSRVCISNVRPG